MGRGGARGGRALFSDGGFFGVLLGFLVNFWDGSGDCWRGKCFLNRPSVHIYTYSRIVTKFVTLKCALMKC